MQNIRCCEVCCNSSYIYVKNECSCLIWEINASYLLIKAFEDFISVRNAHKQNKKTKH